MTTYRRPDRTTSIEVERGPGAGRARRALARLRRDAARPRDHLRAARRGARSRSSTRRRRRRSTRASAAGTSCTASRTPGLEKCVGCSLCAAACPADCIRVVAAENTPENRVSRRRALRRGLRDQHDALHLLRLLRGRLPVRRDHDGPRLRAVRLQPLGPDLHEGDAARGARWSARRCGGGERRSRRRGAVEAVVFWVAASAWRSAGRSGSCCSATRSTACCRWSCT